MCSAPLYRESAAYEYITQANQDGKRFGKHFHYNSYSMRSEEPDSNKVIILGLGDSVLNGGAVLDQDSIATTIFSQETGYQMLNISAGSWGPDNCAAFIHENGIFGAKAMFLLVSSHDAYDNMDFLPVVGKHNSYPDKQYAFAWCELFSRYIWPKISKRFNKEKSADPDEQVLEGIGIEKKGKVFNPGFDQLKNIADSASIALYVCLHPDLKEVESGAYNESGKEIIRWCEKNAITPILEIEEGVTPEMFRDGIHMDNRGQRFEAELMKKYILL